MLENGFDSVREGQLIPGKTELSEEARKVSVPPCPQSSHFLPFLAITEFSVEDKEFKDSRNSIVEISTEKTHLNPITDLLRFGVGTRHMVFCAYRALYSDCVVIPEISSWCL